MAHANETLRDVDLRIRTLSSLISKLKPQIASPTFIKQSPPTLTVCDHIAILLTRGIEDSNNAPFGPGREVVAVSGRLTPKPSFIVSIDAVEDPAVAPNTTVTQNLAPKDQPKFEINALKPSPARLEDMAAPPYRVDNDPLSVYAANLLAAFRDLDVKSNGFRFMIFVICSCLPKITHRLRADLYVFGCPLDDILDGWLPGPNDTVTPKQVHVGDPYAKLRPHLASARVVGSEDRYEWNIDTASLWITALCHFIKETKRLASNCRNRDNNTIDSDALLDLVYALIGLQFMSYCVPIRQLLSLPSIQSRLNLDFKVSVEDLASDDDGPDMTPEHGDDSSSMALRYLRNAVAWNTAVIYICNAVHNSPSFKDITLEFVVTPIASPDTCASEEGLVDRAIPHMLVMNFLDPRSETAKSLVEEFKKRVLPVKFSGTVHCEASIMGMIVACKDDMTPLPNGMKREELDAFQKVVTNNGVSVIGLGKKCCWFCYLLASKLHRAHPGISFETPMSHGLIFPWALPTIGISVDVAKAMETALTKMWVREVVKFAERFPRPSKNDIQRAPSPPPRSTCEGPPDVLLEVMPRPSSGLYRGRIHKVY